MNGRQEKVRQELEDSIQAWLHHSQDPAPKVTEDKEIKESGAKPSPQGWPPEAQKTASQQS